MIYFIIYLIGLILSIYLVDNFNNKNKGVDEISYYPVVFSWIYVFSILVATKITKKTWL